MRFLQSPSMPRLSSTVFHLCVCLVSLQYQAAAADAAAQADKELKLLHSQLQALQRDAAEIEEFLAEVAQAGAAGAVLQLNNQNSVSIEAVAAATSPMKLAGHVQVRGSRVGV